jgi:hypothetical protein
MEAFNSEFCRVQVGIDTNRGREAAVCTEAKLSRENIGMSAK